MGQAADSPQAGDIIRRCGHGGSCGGKLLVIVVSIFPNQTRTDVSNGNRGRKVTVPDDGFIDYLPIPLSSPKLCYTHSFSSDSDYSK